jgi:hypothetical protein
MIRKLAASIFGLVALLLGWVAIGRARMTYTEEGRYFDPVDAVTYDEGAVAVYALMAAAFALIALLVAGPFGRSKRG